MNFGVSYVAMRRFAGGLDTRVTWNGLVRIGVAAVAMLACARLGAVHSVVFGGFSAESIKDRVADCGAVAVITADGGYRRGQVLPLKRFADDVIAKTTDL